jgi:glycosyltransferase involved in cell wall biosynthesis
VDKVKNPKVSILIPVYNRGKIINKTVNSALQQSYENIEVVIVDNNSQDNTYKVITEIANKDKRVRVYKNDVNLGPVKNWLKCLEYSSGEYIKFLWSDDLIAENFLEETLIYLQDNDDVGFAYSPVILIDIDDKEIKNMYNLHKEDVLIDSTEFLRLSIVGGTVPVSPGCALFRRKDILQNLIIDIPNDDNLNFNKFGAGNDQLIFLFTCKNYLNVAYVSTTKSYFRSHLDSFTMSNDLSLYYSWAKLYFISIYENKNLSELLKSRLLFSSLINPRFKTINSKLKSRPSLYYFAVLLLNAVTFKFRNIFMDRKGKL